MDFPDDSQAVVAFDAREGDAALFEQSSLDNAPKIIHTDEDGDYCRICRGEGTAEQQLFYPCKCSGSIRFVHQDCLMEWLSHSQKKYCELCKTPFTFTKLYDRSMPEKLPLPLFLRQIVIHTARGVLRWTRFFMVGFVWLGWLPWSIRQVWRGLFWLADGSWVPSTGIGGDVVATVNSTTGSLANASSPLTSSFALGNLSNAAIRAELANSIPKIFAPISAFLTFATDEFLVVKLVRLLFPNFLRWATRFFSGTASSADAANPNKSARLPSLLSDVTYFETLTTHSVVNNAVVDVLEGQLICLLIVTAFILVFLIREWVINQQPAANVPDPDRADERAAPLQVNRELRPVVRRRRRRGLREALDQRERVQIPGRPPGIDGPRLVNVEMNPREEHTEAPVDIPSQQDPSQNGTTPFTEDGFDSAISETSTRGFGSPVSLHAPLPTSEVRPTLQSRNALDQAVDIRRKIEEGTADIENLEDLNSVALPHTADQTLVWASLQETDFNFDDFANSDQDGLADPLANTFGSSHTELEYGTVAGNEAPVHDVGGLSHGSVFPTQAGEVRHGQHETVDGDPQSSDDSTSQTVDVVATPATSGTEHDGPLSEADEERHPETLGSTSGGDEPTLSESDDNVAAITTFWDQIANWLWHIDDNTRSSADGMEDDEHTAQDVAGELPFIPPHALQEDVARHNDDLADGGVAEGARAQADNPFGIDANNADAIEEAEDLDGILELIGMQGPITGMIQNVIFSEFLITLTIAASVWLPYIWGKIALLILADPVGMFLKAPLYLASRAADTVVDIILFVASLAIFATYSCISFCIPWLTIIRPGWASAIGKSVFMSKSLTVANKSLAMAKGSGTRLEKALSGTFLVLRPDLPTFSVSSHEALRTFEHNLAKGLDTAITAFTSLFQQSPSRLQSLVCDSLRDRNGNVLTPWALKSAVRESALFVTSWAIQRFKTMTTDLGGIVVPSQPEPLDHALIRWSSRDKVLAIVLGYTFLSVVGYLYLKISRLLFGLRSGEKVEGMVADALNQAGGVMKVILIIGIEMIVFPLYCGMLLDVALMPLFAGVTFQSRLNFLVEAPMTALFVHWFLGTCYMFHFALFVSMCRKIMRKGVLYFIRDPDDPTFHPVRDVLERPVLGQLSKIAFSALVYGGLVMLCLGGVIWALTCIKGILPINWVTDDPKFDLPVDVIFYNFFLPILIRKIEPSKKITAAWEWWFRGCARGLRLTHFLFDEVNEEERGTSRRWFWKPFGVDRETGVDFQPDGSFVRAPASDAVRIPKGDRVFLQVNENNERVDGLEDQDDGPHGKANKNFAKVYIPPNFRARIATFIILIWLFAAATGVLFTVIPLLLGRSIIAILAPLDRPPNDLYAFTIGMHLCGAIAYAAAYYRECKDWLAAKASALFVDTRQILPKFKSSTLYLLGMTYMSAVFGIVLPFGFSVIFELYFLMPLFTYLMSNHPIAAEDVSSSKSRLPTTIHVIQTWTLGLLYLRLALRFATAYRNGQTRAATAVRAILRNGFLRPDVPLATRAFVVPALVVSSVLVAVPQGLGWMINAFLEVQEPEQRMKVYRYAYPGVLAGFLAGYCAGLLERQIGVWRIRIRDEVYLIGERLHNFGEGGKSNRAVARQRSVGVGMERVDVDIH